jgi:hypothetical protein
MSTPLPPCPAGDFSRVVAAAIASASVIVAVNVLVVMS